MRFVLVGVLNTALGLLIIYALMFFASLHPLVANVTGYLIGAGLSFWLNKNWTFRSEHSTPSLLPKYIAIYVVAFSLNFGAVVGILATTEIDPYLVQLIGVSTYSIVMFAGSRRIMFTR